MQSGQVLSGFELMTETYGELNSDKSNAVLVCHAFSGNHHAAGIKDGEKKPGWWDEIIGDDKTIDTTKFLLSLSIILVAVMAPLDLSFPLNWESKPYGASFPEVSVSDWVEDSKTIG